MRRLEQLVNVDVWMIKLTDSGPLGADSAFALLAPHERAGAERHRNDDDRSRSLIAQAALRQLVASRISGNPEDVVIGRDPRGRPLVQSVPALRASIAHSGMFVTCAVASRDVGIDIEAADRREADEYFAHRVCAPAELRELDRRPAEERRAALIRLWVRKEAFTKALGSGLGFSFATLDVRRDTPLISCVAERGWRVRDLPAPDGYLAAVAARGSRWRVRTRRFAD